MHKILLVENNDKLRSAYCDELKAQGYEVVVAEDKSTAVEKLREEAIDAIVYDMGTPRGQDFDTLRRIVEVDKNAKVILGLGNSRERWDFRSWIADGFFPRPDGSGALVDTVNRVLGYRKDTEQFANENL